MNGQETAEVVAYLIKVGQRKQSLQRPKVQADWQWERRRALSPSPLGRWGKPENIYKYAHAYTRIVAVMHLGSIDRGEERIKHLNEPVEQAQTFQVISECSCAARGSTRNWRREDSSLR